MRLNAYASVRKLTRMIEKRYKRETIRVGYFFRRNEQETRFTPLSINGPHSHVKIKSSKM